MSTRNIILLAVGATVLAIALPVIEVALVAAAATTGASTAFTSALTISELVLGFAPVGVLLLFLKQRKGGG